MRVIAGSAKSMPLKTIAGMETRPTTDRIKETLFNMLQPHLCESRVLDLVCRQRRNRHRGFKQRCRLLCLCGKKQKSSGSDSGKSPFYKT